MVIFVFRNDYDRRPHQVLFTQAYRHCALLAAVGFPCPQPSMSSLLQFSPPLLFWKSHRFLCLLDNCCLRDSLKRLFQYVFCYIGIIFPHYRLRNSKQMQNLEVLSSYLKYLLTDKNVWWLTFKETCMRNIFLPLCRKFNKSHLGFFNESTSGLTALGAFVKKTSVWLI